MSLPNQNMDFTAFDTLPAASLDDLVENIEALAAGTGLNDSAITPAKLLAGAGTSWTWQSWTPTYTNLTVGNGTHQSYYTKIGKTIIAELGFIFGSTSSMGTSPFVSLPVTSSPNYVDGAWIGGLRMAVAGVGYTGYVQWTTTTTAYLLALGSGGPYLTDANWNSGVPNTWGNGNTFHGTIIYQAA